MAISRLYHVIKYKNDVFSSHYGHRKSRQSLLTMEAKTAEPESTSVSHINCPERVVVDDGGCYVTFGSFLSESSRLILVKNEILRSLKMPIYIQ